MRPDLSSSLIPVAPERFQNALATDRLGLETLGDGTGQGSVLRLRAFVYRVFQDHEYPFTLLDGEEVQSYCGSQARVAV